MSNVKPVRFEVPLSPSRYGELEELAHRFEISPRDIGRIAIVQLLENPALLGRADPVGRTGAAA
jgi:hypothetical protein